jgi:predicted transcriptional regulator
MEKRQLSFRLDAQLVKKLKFVAVEHDKNQTDLLTEAIEDLLAKYDKQEKKPKK